MQNTYEISPYLHPIEIIAAAANSIIELNGQTTKMVAKWMNNYELHTKKNLRWTPLSSTHANNSKSELIGMIAKGELTKDHPIWAEVGDWNEPENSLTPGTQAAEGTSNLTRLGLRTPQLRPAARRRWPARRPPAARPGPSLLAAL